MEVQTPRRRAASRTEKSLGHTASCEQADCNSGVTRRLKSPAKSGQRSVLAVDRFPIVPYGCQELPVTATPTSLPVTPEATGSSPVHPAKFLRDLRLFGWGPLSRLQNFSKSAANFSSRARGNVTTVRTSDPVYPRRIRAVPRSRGGGASLVKPNYAPRRSSIARSREGHPPANHLGKHLWNRPEGPVPLLRALRNRVLQRARFPTLNGGLDHREQPLDGAVRSPLLHVQETTDHAGPTRMTAPRLEFRRDAQEDAPPRRPVAPVEAVGDPVGVMRVEDIDHVEGDGRPRQGLKEVARARRPPARGRARAGCCSCPYEARCRTPPRSKVAFVRP